MTEKNPAFQIAGNEFGLMILMAEKLKGKRYQRRRSKSEQDFAETLRKSRIHKLPGAWTFLSAPV